MHIETVAMTWCQDLSLFIERQLLFWKGRQFIGSSAIGPALIRSRAAPKKPLTWQPPGNGFLGQLAKRIGQIGLSNEILPRQISCHVYRFVESEGLHKKQLRQNYIGNDKENRAYKW